MAVTGKTAAPHEVPYFIGGDKPPDMAAVTKAIADRVHARLPATKRVATGTVAKETYAAVVVTWATAFADANYTVQAAVEETTVISNTGLQVVRLVEVTKTGLTVVVYNAASGNRSGIVHVTAFHD